MLDTYARSLFQKWCVDSVAHMIGRFCTANIVTAMSLIMGLCVPVALLFVHPILAVICLVISGYLDTLDGTIARDQNSESDVGCVFDIVSDRIVEFGAVLGLFFVDPTARGFYCILMLGSILVCITSFLVVGIFTKHKESKKSFFYSVGLMERAEAFLFFALMMLMPAWFVSLAMTFAVLVTFTALFRIYQFVQSEEL